MARSPCEGQTPTCSATRLPCKCWVGISGCRCHFLSARNHGKPRGLKDHRGPKRTGCVVLLYQPPIFDLEDPPCKAGGLGRTLQKSQAKRLTTNDSFNCQLDGTGIINQWGVGQLYNDSGLSSLNPYVGLALEEAKQSAFIRVGLSGWIEVHGLCHTQVGQRRKKMRGEKAPAGNGAGAP